MENRPTKICKLYVGNVITKKVIKDIIDTYNMFYVEDPFDESDFEGFAQLTKKVGGMDRQIAKLNKSIEKIASHVVEK